MFFFDHLFNVSLFNINECICFTIFYKSIFIKKNIQKISIINDYIDFDFDVFYFSSCNNNRR